jgi:hypothetical protein
MYTYIYKQKYNGAVSQRNETVADRGTPSQGFVRDRSAANMTPIFPVGGK